MSRLPRRTPESQGISSHAILRFIDSLEHDRQSIHSFMLLRHGSVVAEGWWKPYRPDLPHVLFSLSKSFTSTAIGMLISEGRLSVDDPVLKFFPKEAPSAPSDNLQAMRIHHLLSMSTGHSIEPFAVMPERTRRTWVKVFLEHPVPFEPGTHWLYNSSATYMLSAIVHQITGGRLIDYLRPRLFEPLGIVNPAWETSPQGIDTGGWGLSITTEDIAAFGQLYLQKGMWEGKQLLPETWIQAATSIQTDNAPNENIDWAQGYGYQFWRCRHNAYRGDGAFGQYCIVMPDQDAVLVITAGLANMQPPLDRVWQHLLPAMQRDPLPADRDGEAALSQRLAGLCLTTVEGNASSSTAPQVSGTAYKLTNNPDKVRRLRFDFGMDNCRITFITAHGEQAVEIGYGGWLLSSVNLPPLDGSMRSPAAGFSQTWKTAGSGAWTDERTFVAKVWWIETPFACTFNCRFSGKRLVVEQKGNVGFTPTEGPTLHGTQAQF